MMLSCQIQRWMLCMLLLAPETTYQQSENSQSSAFTPDEMFQDMFPLTAHNFTSKVLRNKDPWIVIFHDGTMDKAWKTMAVNLRGIVWIGTIDTTLEKDLVYDLKHDTGMDPPTRVYPFGSRTTKQNWNAAKTPNEARSLAIKSYPDRALKLKGDDIQDFLMDSFLTSPSKFPLILFLEEQETPTLYKALAVRFEKYFNFGKIVNPTTDDLQKIGMSNTFVETPSIFVLITQGGGDGSQKEAFHAIKYDQLRLGNLNYTNIMQFLFYINNQYRHLLPGDNQSNKKTEAEMDDVVKIEQQRFDVKFSGRNWSSKGARQQPSFANDAQPKFKVTSEIHGLDSKRSDVKDEL